MRKLVSSLCSFKCNLHRYVKESWRAGPYAMTVGGRDKYGNVVIGTARAYEAATMEGMVCPPATNLTAPTGTAANCTCGYRTNCAQARFGSFTAVGDGTYKGDLDVPVKGNNSLYVSASYTNPKRNSGGFGDGVARHQVWPVRVLIVPNVVSIRSTVVTAPTQYRAGGEMEFEVQAIDIYGNYITEGGESANISTFTLPGTHNGKIDPETKALQLTPHKVVDLQTGRYKVTVMTVLAANYNVSFKVNSQPALRGPWFVTVVAAGVTLRTTAVYPTSAVAGIDNNFLIEPRDMYDNVITADDQLGGTCEPTGNTYNCPAVVSLYDEALNLLPLSSSKPWFEYVNNTYYGHFSPPTNSTRHVYIRVFITDTAVSADPIAIVGSTQPGKYVDVIPGPAEYDTSDFFINDTQGVGYVFVGVYPRDQFYNPCDFKRPSDFTVWALDDRNSSKIVTDIVDVNYYGKSGTETMVLDQVKRVGRYELQLLLRAAAPSRLVHRPAAAPVQLAPPLLGPSSPPPPAASSRASQSRLLGELLCLLPRPRNQ